MRILKTFQMMRSTYAEAQCPRCKVTLTLRLNEAKRRKQCERCWLFGYRTAKKLPTGWRLTGEAPYSYDPLYAVWNGMINRCHGLLPHPRYGGRGIQVCAEWRKSFVAFRDWARANYWERGLEIHRKDNDGDYTPDNCCFLNPNHHQFLHRHKSRN